MFKFMITAAMTITLTVAALLLAPLKDSAVSYTHLDVYKRQAYMDAA